MLVAGLVGFFYFAVLGCLCAVSGATRSKREGAVHQETALF